MHRNRKALTRLLVASLALGAVVACAVASASAASQRVRVGSASALPVGAKLAGALPAASKVALAIALQPQDPSGLQSFATAVSTPGSAEFRHYLSVSKFAQRYGATSAQIAAVVSTLRSDGLTVGTPMADHLIVPVSGTAAQVQRAFATRLSQVKLADGKTAYANTVAPTVAPQIAGDVQGVIGLNSFVTARSLGPSRSRSALLRGRSRLGPALGGGAFRAQMRSRPNVVTGGPQPCPAATSAADSQGGYTADTIASAYQFSSLYPSDLGGGQTIAMYELQPYNPADVAAYQGCYGTAASVTNVNVDSPPAFSGGDDAEAALDIEQAIGLAPAAKIIVYQAPNNGPGLVDNFATIASQNTAKVVSSSWGICEPTALSGGPALVNAENSVLQELAAQGQSLYVASGDSGSAACNPSGNNVLAVGDPASQPFATSVGGTTLFTTDSSGNPFLWTPGNPVDQSVWNDGAAGGKASGSTGGISKQWAMPAYQSTAASAVGVINAKSSSVPCGQAPFCRQVPDVSADSDFVTGYVVFANGAWTVIGGTSAAAPLWAAATAEINAAAPCRGLTVGFVNPALYQIAGTAYAANFSDVQLASPVSGRANNDAVGTNGGLFPVTAGYDMATGLGTPVLPALTSSLCAVTSPVYAVTVTNPGNQSTIIGQAVSVGAHATDSGGAPLTYAASGLPAGLTINAASGLISGTPTTVGTSTVTVVATDKYTNTSSTQFGWAIVPPPPGPPTLSNAKLSGVKSGRPKLAFTISAGINNALALQSVSVSLPRGVRFAKKTKSLAKGISVKTNGAKVKFKARVRHGLLTITLKQSEPTVSVTIRKPAISVTRTLKSKVRHHKVKKLSFGLRATDTSNHTTTLAIRLKV